MAVFACRLQPGQGGLSRSDDSFLLSAARCGGLQPVLRPICQHPRHCVCLCLVRNMTRSGYADRPARLRRFTCGQDRVRSQAGAHIPRTDIISPDLNSLSSLPIVLFVTVGRCRCRSVELYPALMFSGLKTAQCACGTRAIRSRQRAYCSATREQGRTRPPVWIGMYVSRWDWCW